MYMKYRFFGEVIGDVKYRVLGGIGDVKGVYFGRGLCYTGEIFGPVQKRRRQVFCGFVNWPKRKEYNQWQMPKK